MSLPWFKMYQRAFMMATMHLTTEAQGAYLRLMFSYYDREKPPADDDESLAQITGLSVERWRHHRTLIEPFFIIADGVWRNEKCEEEIASRQVKIEANRENGKRPKSQRKATGQATGLPTGTPNGVPNDQANNEPDFGPSQPSVTAPSHSPPENGTQVPQNTQQEATGLASGSAIGIPNGSQSLDKKTLREGANAPSSASELSIGSLLRSDWAPAGETIAAAKAEGVTVDELAAWLDDWRSRCIDAGTRIVDWDAAWAREYHRRMIERAKKKPKPRVTVSKARLTKVPDGWQPNDTHHKIVAERLKQEGRELDIPRCIESFADYIENKRPDWSSADAAFRTWLKSPHRTEFKTNGQAPQRRAPAPGGSSIVDAFDRLDATLAARGRALAEDQPDGEAAVLSLPEE